MKIDFDKIETSVIKNFKGGEKQIEAKMFVDKRNRIMNAKLEPGASIGVHTHDTSSEIIFIVKGTGKAICEGIEEPLKAGDCHYCLKGQTHTLINNGTEDLLFLAVVPQQA